jgi:hypothetical protein
MYTGFSWGSLKERDFLEDLGVDRWIVRKSDLPGIEWEHGLNIWSLIRKSGVLL